MTAGVQAECVLCSASSRSEITAEVPVRFDVDYGGDHRELPPAPLTTEPDRRAQGLITRAEAAGTRRRRDAHGGGVARVPVDVRATSERGGTLQIAWQRGIGLGTARVVASDLHLFNGCVGRLGREP